jgi:hypothetical protein
MFLFVHTRVFMTGFNVSQVCLNINKEVAEFAGIDTNIAKSINCFEVADSDLTILRYV